MRRILAIALVLCLLSVASFAEGVDYSYGDVTIGYLASSGASMNPFMCKERDMISINSLVYESLFELDADLKPQAVLAETWAQNGKEWVISVRSGVLFHNGVELTAQDVVESYALFKNAGDENPYKSALKLINDVVALDQYTVQVSAKYSGLLTMYALTFPIVQRNTASTALPMGTGPYWFIGYQADTGARLEANPLWWKKQPEIRSIVFKHYWDISESLSALQSGEVEMLMTRSYSAALTKKLSYANSLDYATSTYETLVPGSGGSVTDVRLKRAVMYAIDYNTLIGNVYLDMAQQCEVPVPPSSWLYESRSAVFYYSPERALQLIQECGWRDLTGDTMVNKLENNVLSYLNMKIITYEDETSNVRGNAAEQIVENLRAVGINATFEILEKSEVQKKLKSGNYDLALIAVNLSETPNLIPILSEGGAANFSGAFSDSMNELLGGTVTAATETDLKAAYSAIQLSIVDELPFMGICFRTGMVLSTRPLSGLIVAREYDAYNGMEFLVK